MRFRPNGVELCDHLPITFRFKKIKPRNQMHQAKWPFTQDVWFQNILPFTFSMAVTRRYSLRRSAYTIWTWLECTNGSKQPPRYESVYSAYEGYRRKNETTWNAPSGDLPRTLNNIINAILGSKLRADCKEHCLIKETARRK